MVSYTPKPRPVTDEERKILEKWLQKAEPYTEEERKALLEDDPAYDDDRMNATIAKLRLEGKI